MEFCWNKTQRQCFSFEICLICSFSFLFNLLNKLIGEVPKTVLFFLIILQKKSVKAHSKSNTNFLCCNHFESIDLFKLSVARCMFSVDSCQMKKRFDIYFCKILTVHNYHTRLVSLPKCYSPKEMKTSLA